MAVRSKDKERKPAGGGHGFGGGSRGPVFKIVMFSIIGIFVALCLLGVINQVRFGTSFVDGFVKMSDELGKGMYHVFGNDDKSPVEATQDGVYLKGHTPSDNDKNKEEEEKKKAEEEHKKAMEEHKKNVQDPNRESGS